jgi:ATP-dependent RNA helicase DDX46/PRP5
MARHGETRSPSPVGSSYSSSKRSRKDETRHDRSRRDDGRNHRKRTRSRSPDVRFESKLTISPYSANALSIQHRHRGDRDSYRHRERSIDRRDYRDDRRDEDTYRPVRRDRSRDRRRSKDREAGRDYRRRSRDRDRDYRTRRDDSRERARRRRDDSTDSKRKGRRDDSRDKGPDKDSGTRSRDVRCSLTTRPSTLNDDPINVRKQDTKPSTPTTQTAEEKRNERLAKLEAWKQKQAAERERKQKELEAAGGARSILDEIDRKSNASPAIASPAIASPVSPATPNGAATPIPYAGKFDPKAIAKKAALSSTGSSLLGKDIALPDIAKASATVTSTTGINIANKPVALQSSSTGMCLGPYIRNPCNILTFARAASSSVPLKARGNVSGFGLGSKANTDADKASSKRALDFGDEESTRKKLEKLPTPPLEDSKDSVTNVDTNGVQEEDEDDDDDVDMEDIGTEEEAAAAARVAAEKREERLQQEGGLDQSEEPPSQAVDASNTNGDVSMTDVTAQEQPEPVADEEEEEDADPLDAFMSGLTEPTSFGRFSNGLKIPKRKQQEPEAMFGDDNEDMQVPEGEPEDFSTFQSKLRKKKDLPAVNHAKMNYDSFRKNFYTEPSEYVEMTEEQVADLRLELDGIKIRGVDVPKPVQKWSQCGLGVQSLGVIQKLGYDAPTSIQSQAIPAIMSGRDVIGVAKTGSGKTVAFLLPMFRHIKDQRALDSLDGPVGLIMTPTRELATQIHKDCRPFLKALNLRAVCAYGGAPIKDQIADLKRGAEIIVCTPGRMIDLLAANSGRVTNLRRVTYIVLDEADRMFDMGFEPQVMKILGNIRPDRQTVLFSATFPRQMEALARKTLSKPVEIIVGGRSVVAPEITQIVEVRNEDTKFLRLLELLGNLYEDDKNEDDRVLIFVDRQESADGLLRDLMRKGYPCMSIHGGKDQNDRDSTISDFKAGVVPILIATSVAARGLDVKQLKLVVNYDAPNHLEDYVHRAGRTGRAGNTGTAVTFLTDEQERYSVDIAKALKQSGQPVPEPVQKLVGSFMDKVKAGKEKASGSGFGGKGLERLDQERDAARNRERKTYKTGEEGEDEEKEDKNEAGDDLVAKAASSIQSSLAPAPAPAVASLPGVPKGIDLDGKITVHKTEVPAASGGAAKDPLSKVAQAVNDIRSRLGQTGVTRGGAPIDNKGPDAGAFHATLEINDFPRKFTPITPQLSLSEQLTNFSVHYRKSTVGRHEQNERGQNPRIDRDVHHNEGVFLPDGQGSSAWREPEAVYSC